MKRYYILVKGWACALEIMGDNEKDARRRFRQKQGFGKRLPKGTISGLVS